MNLYVGTSGFAYKEWKGRFYPQDLPARQMLHYYGRHFGSVEINNTFYRMPAASVLQAWAGEVGPDFKFALKAPQRITHFGRLRNSGDSVAYLFGVAQTLGERLGPVLFQLPPDFRADAARLRDFLALLPRGHRVAFEFRHPSWFGDDILGMMRDHGVALCIAEAEDGLSVPPVATADWGYVRLRNRDYEDAALSAWLETLQRLNWQDAFIYFKHEDDARGPQIAHRFLQLAHPLAAT